MSDADGHRAVFVSVTPAQINAMSASVRDAIIATRDDLGLSDIEAMSTVFMAVGMLALRCGLDLCDERAMQSLAQLVHLGQHLPPAAFASLPPSDGGL